MKIYKDLDTLLIEQAARQFIKAYRQDAHRCVCDHAILAREKGDKLSADTWNDIAKVVKRLLNASAISTSGHALHQGEG